MRVQGYHATGLNQIVEESKAPKGSLYHYFPQGKEELAAEAIRAAGRSILERVKHLFATCRAGEVLDKMVDHTIAELEASDYQNGCPIAVVGLEVASIIPGLQQLCGEMFQNLVTLMCERFREQGLSEEKARELATTVFAGYEGALLLSRVTRDPSHLRNMGRHLNETIMRAYQEVQ